MSQRFLNDIAQQGWKLITVVPHLDFFYYHFERPTTESLNKLEDSGPWVD